MVLPWSEYLSIFSLCHHVLLFLKKASMMTLKDKEEWTL